MKKQILNFGTALSKAQQKSVFGGGVPIPLKKYDPNCDRIVNEGTCWGYQVGGGVSGSGYHEFPCDC